MRTSKFRILIVLSSIFYPLYLPALLLFPIMFFSAESFPWFLFVPFYSARYLGFSYYIYLMRHEVAQLVLSRATSRNFAGSIPVGIIDKLY